MMNILAYLRRHLWITIGVIVFLVFAYGIYALTRPSQPTYLTATATRGDLRQTVEAVGTIISERDLDLQFAGTDIVSDVFVREGDKVKSGQKLAALRSGVLRANIASASAGVQSAYAALQAVQQGSRPEDILISEATLANQRASLEAARQSLTNAEENIKAENAKLKTLQQEVLVGMSSEVSTTTSTIAQQLSVAKTALRTTEGVFNQNDVQDVVIKAGSADVSLLQSQIGAAIASIDGLTSAGSYAGDYQGALNNLNRARALVAQAASITDQAYNVLSTLPSNGFFTDAKRETYKATIAVQRSSVQGALSGLDAETKALRDLSATYDSRLAAEQSTIASLKGVHDRAQADILTYQTAVQIGEAQLNLKKAPARQTDIDAAIARLRQTQADLARAASQYRDTVLVAPVDGVITKVNAKAGEIRPMTLPSVTMLGSSPLRIEMFISEVDIPKVTVSQSGSIKLDAFRDTNYQLRVSEIDPAPTTVDGVDKYRARLDFLYLHAEFRIGMSGDVTIVTGERKDVIRVPSRAIIQDNAGNTVVRVLGKDGKTVTTKQVISGMEGEGGDTEIISGVADGDNVITLTKK